MITKLNLPEQMAEAVLAAYQSKPEYYDRQAENAYKGEIPDFPICKKSPFDRAVILCRCLDVTYGKYKATGLPEKIIWDTFADITLRLSLYQKNIEKIGLSREDVIWFRHLWNCEIFQIGSLQYHKFHMLYLDAEGIGEDYMVFDKKPVPVGAPVWNIHVPRGADLSVEAVEGSMSQATILLPSVFPAHKADNFLCYSWLLYPELKKLLPGRSNIRCFADSFTVIGTVQDPSEAIRCIYGKRYPRKDMYPRDTSLQRCAVGNFSCLGYGCGLKRMDNT